jgi:hypothetical protein
MKHFQGGQTKGSWTAGHVARIEQMQNEYAILLGNLSEGDISVDLRLEKRELLRRMLTK